MLESHRRGPAFLRSAPPSRLLVDSALGEVVRREYIAEPSEGARRLLYANSQRKQEKNQKGFLSQLGFKCFTSSWKPFFTDSFPKTLSLPFIKTTDVMMLVSVH